jgi:outer membrane protein TolC
MAAALLAIGCGFGAQAQPRTLTLDEAVSLAKQHSSAVKIADHKVSEMDARIREAKANYFPVLSNETDAVHIAEQQHLEIPSGSLGVYPGIGPLPAAGVSLAQGNSNFLMSTTTVSQPITQYFKTRAGVDVARADAASARAEARHTTNDIAFKVKEVYYAILTTEHRRDALDAQIRAAELRSVETKNAIDTGVALEVKATEVTAQIAQARHARGQLQDSVDDMRLELSDLVGLPLDTNLALAPPTEACPDQDPSPEPAAVTELALAHNPEIEAASGQVEKARAGLRAARAEYIPEVGAFAQYIHQNGAPFLSPNNGAVGLHMTWTMFEFGKRHGQVSERTAVLAQAEENLAQMRRRVQIDIEKAVRRLNRAETGLDSAKQVLTSATEARRVTSDQVEAGTANRSALLDAEAALSGAKADVLRAEYDRSVAAADLARLQGSL